MRFIRHNLLVKVILGMSLIFLASSGVVLAQDYGLKKTVDAANMGGQVLPTNINGASTIPVLIGEIVQIVLSLIGIVFFLLIFYAGFNWMIAQGNTEKIEQSKGTLINAAIGLIIVLAAYAITNFVIGGLNAPSQTAPTSVSTLPTGSSCPSTSISTFSVTLCYNKKVGDSCTMSANSTCLYTDNYSSSGPACYCN